MLLFDDSKRLEKALGEEAASAIAHVLERADEKWRQELATRADLMTVKADLEVKLAAIEGRLTAEIAKSRAETIKWTAGMLIAQAAVVATLVKLL